MTARGWVLRRLCALAIAFALMPPGVATACTATPAPGCTASGDFPALGILRSRNGVLVADFVAMRKVISIDGMKIDTLSFNGAYAGPVLRLAPGDRLVLRLRNAADLPVNIHFHGSHASPLGHGDNMHVVVAPGASFEYRLVIPATQPPGLYWYHAHVHGMADQEVNRGLSGAMIIDGIEHAVPETAHARSRLMVLKTYTGDETDDAVGQRLHGILQTINGAAHSTIAARSGQTEFWRLSNQSPDDYLHLSASGLSFRVVAMDGAQTNRDLPVASLDIPPAGTLEVMATMPVAGRYRLLSGSTPTGSGAVFSLDRELAAIDVQGAGKPAVAPRLVARAPQMRDLRLVPVSAHRLIVFSESPDQGKYLINGKIFQHDRIDTRVPLGSIEEWTIRNDSDDMHVFHIHQLHFQVVAINGQKQPFDGVVDVVRVPERGSVTLRIPFTDPQIVGRFMYHCHVMMHEDHGMMANIEIYKPGVPAVREAEMSGMRMGER